MSKNLFFKINHPGVIGEVIDNEAIIVNLDSGAYYSLRSSGADIWQMIDQGATITTIIDQFARHYPRTEKEVIAAAIQALITELQQEQLIVPLEKTTAPGEPAPLSALTGQHNGHFEAPALEKYTDMADLLLLDPIHEVDEADGWPHPPQIAPGQAAN